MNHLLNRNGLRRDTGGGREARGGGRGGGVGGGVLGRRRGKTRGNSPPNDTSTGTSIGEELTDREGRLREFMLHWIDYLEESESELLLAELELNRRCVKYLFQQTQQLPRDRRPKKLFLNSCKYDPTDGTAQLLVRYMQSSTTCAHSLEAIRLESAYVGHLPAHTASTLLHGLPGVHSLRIVQLVDIDLRPTTVAEKLANLVHASSCQTLELRHCRMDDAALLLLGRALQCDATSFQRLIFHACVLDDDLCATFCHALTTQVETNATTHCKKSLKHLALPSNRCTAASIPTISNLLSKQDQLQSLDVQRMSRLFAKRSWPIPDTNTITTSTAAAAAPVTGTAAFNNGYKNGSPSSFEDTIQSFCFAVQQHPCLQKLDLSRCGVTDELVDELFRALQTKSSTQLYSFAMKDGNSFHPSGFADIVASSHASSLQTLQELCLGGNELSSTAEWVTRLPSLPGLRRLDLPKQATGRRGWYNNSGDTTTSNNNNNINNNYNDNEERNGTKIGIIRNGGESPTLFWTCLQQNIILQYVSHDGVPSQPASHVLERNALLQQAEDVLFGPSSSSSSPPALLPPLLYRCNAQIGTTARYALLQHACARHWLKGGGVTSSRETLEA